MAWIGALASVAGGLLASDSAGDAADAQSAAADRASATQERARVQQRADLMPWMQGGQTANNALLYRLGLGGSAGGSGGASRSLDQIRAELVAQQPTAAPPMWDGWDSANEIQWMQGKPYKGYSSGGENWDYRPIDMPKAAPGIDVDQRAQEIFAQEQAAQQQGQQQAQQDPNYGSLLRKFNQSDLDSDLVFQNTYKTALNTGTNALNARAANAGGWGSGAALKALTRFGADTANTYTGGAYSRNMQEKGQTFDFLSNVSRQGQSAAAGVGAAGIATGNAIAGNQLAAGNAQSAGIVGGANALSGGIADATNAYQWNQLLSKKAPAWQTPGFGTGSLYGNQDLGSYL